MEHRQGTPGINTRVLEAQPTPELETKRSYQYSYGDNQLTREMITETIAGKNRVEKDRLMAWNVSQSAKRGEAINSSSSWYLAGAGITTNLSLLVELRSPGGPAKLPLLCSDWLLPGFSSDQKEKNPNRTHLCLCNPYPISESPPVCLG